MPNLREYAELTPKYVTASVNNKVRVPKVRDRSSLRLFSNCGCDVLARGFDVLEGDYLLHVLLQSKRRTHADRDTRKYISFECVGCVRVYTNAIGVYDGLCPYPRRLCFCATSPDARKPACFCLRKCLWAVV